MARPLFPWDQSDPEQKAFRAGAPIYQGTLGVFPESEQQAKRNKNVWRAELLDQPRTSSLYNDSLFTDDLAAQSQQKLFNSSQTAQALFRDPRVSAQANRFLDGYSRAIGTILSSEEAVTPERLQQYFMQRPTDNLAGKFPSQGVV